MKVLLLPVYYSIKLKNKIWVLYKLKIKACGKEIIVLLISVTTLKEGISTYTTTNVSFTLSMTACVCRLPLRSHLSKYLSMRHH